MPREASPNHAKSDEHLMLKETNHLPKKKFCVHRAYFLNLSLAYD